MKQILKNLQKYREYISENSSSELFISVNKCYFAECTSEYIDLQYRETQGISERVFYNDCTYFTYSNGISLESLEKAIHKSTNRICMPPNHMISTSNKKIDETKIYKEKEQEISQIDCQILWDDLTKKMAVKGEFVKKLYLQYQKEYYLILSPNGNEGYSKRTIFSPGFELESNDTCFYNIFSYFNTDLAINTLYDNHVQILEEQDCKIDLIDYILFSDTAAIKIIYLLTLILCKDMVLSKGSAFKRSDLRKRLFSKNLDIVENSSQNKIIMGDTDGEGMSRTAKFIVKEGVLQSFFSNYDPDNDFMSTGSAFRFSHLMPPKVQPSKVEVIGEHSVSNIKNDYNNVAQIFDMTGIIESFNPKTTTFDACAIAYLYRNGKLISQQKINIKTNFHKILNNILCVGNDKKYGVDGSILCGSLLIRNVDLI